MSPKNFLAIEDAIRKGVSDWLLTNSQGPSLVTVTEIVFEEKKNQAKVLISVLPKDQWPHVNDFLNRHAGEIREHLKKSFRVQSINYLFFFQAKD